MTARRWLRTHAFALGAVVAALAVIGAEDVWSRGTETCAPTVSGPAKVGAVLRIFHTPLYVRERYVGAAPCDLVTGDTIRTGSRGEVLFQFAVRGRSIRCVVFPLVRLQLSPPQKRSISTTVARFTAGRTWCASGAFVPGSHFAAGAVEVLVSRAVFSAEVVAGKVLIKAGSGSLRLRVLGRPSTLRQGYAILVSGRGEIEGPQRAEFDAKDALALARLR